MTQQFATYIKRYWPKKAMGRLSAIIIILWIFIAIISPFLANDVPIVGKSEEGWSMPIFSKQNISENTKYSFEINPLIPYRFDNLDLKNNLKAPLTKGNRGIHLLGTDQLGRDVAAGMINGARVAFVISTLAILLSSVFGICIGLAIGFYGDRGISRNLVQQFLILGTAIYMIYYIIHLLQDGVTFSTILPLGILGTIFFFLNRLFAQLPLKKYGLPIDIFVQRLFEIKESIPGIFLILAFIAIVSKVSIFSIPLILAVLIWMTFARQARAEALQIKEEAYIKSAKASGLGDYRLMLKHILPNALPSLLVVIAFTFSAVILVESTLSFLGIGLPLEEVSWGKILAEARKSPKSWWLAVFPGMAIFLVLFSFNTIGDSLANYQHNDD